MILCVACAKNEREDRITSCRHRRVLYNIIYDVAITAGVCILLLLLIIIVILIFCVHNLVIYLYHSVLRENARFFGATTDRRKLNTVFVVHDIIVLSSTILYIIIAVYNIIIVSCSRRVAIRNVGFLQRRGRAANMR